MRCFDYYGWLMSIMEKRGLARLTAIRGGLSLHPCPGRGVVFFRVSQVGTDHGRLTVCWALIMGVVVVVVVVVVVAVVGSCLIPRLARDETWSWTSSWLASRKHSRGLQRGSKPASQAMKGCHRQAEEPPARNMTRRVHHKKKDAQKGKKSNRWHRHHLISSQVLNVRSNVPQRRESCDARYYGTCK